LRNQALLERRYSSVVWREREKGGFVKGKPLDITLVVISGYAKHFER
jgi:hypothetical protein